MVTADHCCAGFPSCRLRNFHSRRLRASHSFRSRRSAMLVRVIKFGLPSVIVALLLAAVPAKAVTFVGPTGIAPQPVFANGEFFGTTNTTAAGNFDHYWAVNLVGGMDTVTSLTQVKPPNGNFSSISFE